MPRSPSDSSHDFRLPLKRYIKKLSRGQLSAVGVIVGLASRAPLTFFDEPYLGLDAVARQIFYDRLLEDYAEHPRTIVLSTHLIDEVANLLEHLLVIDQGRILLDRDADEVRGSATTVAGARAAVESFVADRAVIGREGLGGLASVTIDGRLGPGRPHPRRRARPRARAGLAPAAHRPHDRHRPPCRLDRTGGRSMTAVIDQPIVRTEPRSRFHEIWRIVRLHAVTPSVFFGIPWIILGGAWAGDDRHRDHRRRRGCGHREDGRGHALQLGGPLAPVVPRRRGRPGHRPDALVRPGIRCHPTGLLARHER